MSDQFDVDVHDAEALAEIAMLADLIVATSEHEGRVPQDRIDEILGVGSAASPLAAATADRDLDANRAAIDAGPGRRDTETAGGRAGQRAGSGEAEAAGEGPSQT